MDRRWWHREADLQIGSEISALLEFADPLAFLPESEPGVFGIAGLLLDGDYAESLEFDDGLLRADEPKFGGVGIVEIITIDFLDAREGLNAEVFHIVKHGTRRAKRNRRVRGFFLTRGATGSSCARCNNPRASLRNALPVLAGSWQLL
jgi:hypothetical protein